jgi:hypothetical protein
MDGTIITIIVVDAIICGILSAVIASSKGRDELSWGVVGFFFGIFGLIAAVGVTKRETAASTAAERKQGTALPNAVDGRREKKCPDCAEMVLADARICRFCQHEFDLAEEMRFQKEEELRLQKDRLVREAEQKELEIKREQALIAEGKAGRIFWAIVVFVFLAVVVITLVVTFGSKTP